MATLTRRTLAAAFARSFLIQGSWNYRTMLGSGFAFAMLPALRLIFKGDPAGLEASLRRHLEHFNAHPYLSNVALGAVLRLEADGALLRVRLNGSLVNVVGLPAANASTPMPRGGPPLTMRSNGPAPIGEPTEAANTGGCPRSDRSCVVVT